MVEGVNALAMPEREDFKRLLEARHPCVRMSTPEEDHAVGIAVGAAVELGISVVAWSVVKGVNEGLFQQEHDQREDTEHPAAACRWFTRSPEPRVLILIDMVHHLEDPIVRRCLREAIQHARRSRSMVVMVDRGGELHQDIADLVFPFAVPLPGAAEIEAIAADALKKLRDEKQIDIRITRKDFNAIIAHLKGLTRMQVVQLVRDVAMEDLRFDRHHIAGLLERKRMLIQSAGILEHIEEVTALDDLAGYGNLKDWLAKRQRALFAENLPVKLPPPRGVLLLGVPGTGKSACARAIAGSWQRPLLRMDAGKLYGQYIGQSEDRLRNALMQAEAMAPVVLWIDEIEKAFASAAARSSDGGLSQRLFGSLLTWMQDHRSQVFLVATANEIEALPPELLRKGRFDEIFFIDLPTVEVRVDIFRLHIQRLGLDPADYDLRRLAETADGFSGSEIEQTLIAASYDAAADGKGPGQFHIAAALESTVPLSRTMGERINQIRTWASNRCIVT